MHVQLELLAPAKNAEIGIAAIDCGADAVYIAGPAFGARQAAGNSIEDLKKLCAYAHQFGARIFVTLNTILYDDELDDAERLLHSIAEAGADAIIVQDTAIVAMTEKAGGAQNLGIALHASTQCAIRTPEQARFLENLGYSRIVLERELSLEQIRAIRKAVSCEIEFFVHGALCVCYSGQCYISEYISGRSANRGACMQACRSRYDLTDAKGKILVKNKALLSLKDYKLIDKMQDLAEAGVCSFKIEGRLKNISYVKNVVRAYSLALDKLVDQYPDKYCRASYGKVSKGFNPDLDKTFNRGYTELFIDGKRGKWASIDAPKGMGEEIGKVVSIRNLNRDEMEITIRSSNPSLRLVNGDGFSFYTEKEIVGFRGDVCNGLKIRSKKIPEIFMGARIFRNMSVEFEKSLNSNTCHREIPVELQLEVKKEDGLFRLKAEAITEDGRKAGYAVESAEKANDSLRMSSMIPAQLSKRSGIYSFHVQEMPENDNYPFLNSATINAVRRTLADKLDKIPCQARPLANSIPHKEQGSDLLPCKDLTYKQNIANHLSENMMRTLGAAHIEPAFEIGHQKHAELMRTKYCIRYETGLCPRYQKAKESGPLFLVNNGRRFPLEFDCRHCEMVVRTPEE